MPIHLSTMIVSRLSVVAGSTVDQTDLVMDGEACLFRGRLYFISD